jgi:hypothetical protein
MTRPRRTAARTPDNDVRRWLSHGNCGAPVQMPWIYSDSHRQHDPAIEVWTGAPQPGTEIPAREVFPDTVLYPAMLSRVSGRTEPTAAPSARLGYWCFDSGPVAILDLDYHHGNGTQQLYERGDVIYASLHADPDRAFPFFTGYPDETGYGDGTQARCERPGVLRGFLRLPAIQISEVL